MYNWADYVDPGNSGALQEASSASRSSRTTRSRRTRRCSTKLQAGGTGQYDFGAPTAEFTPDMHDQGLIAEDRLVEGPERQVHRQAVQGPLVGPRRTSTSCPRTGARPASRPDKFVKDDVKHLAAVLRRRAEVLGQDRRRRLAGRRLRRRRSRPSAISLNSVDPSELEVVRTELLEPRAARPRPQLRHLRGPDQERGGGPRPDLDRRRRRAPRRPRRPTDIEYIIPEDGTLYWMDTWVIFKDAPHPNAAHAFLNFIQDPQIQAQETVTNRYATPNDEAKKSCPRRSSTTRPCSCRRRSSTRASSRARRTPRRTRSATRSGRSSVEDRVLTDWIRVPARTHSATRPAVAAEAPLAPSVTAAPRTPKVVTTPRSTRVRSGLVTSGLLAGATLWYVLLLVAPLAIVVLFSFGERTRIGGYAGGFTFDNYADRLDELVAVHDEPVHVDRRDDPVPARRPAARLLHRDPGRQPQEPAHRSCSSSRSGRASSSGPTPG